MTQDKPTIYFDNAATTYPKPEVVWQAMDEFARLGGANANRGQNPMARRAARMIDETRVKVAKWVGLPADGQITFAPSATIALNQVILGSGLQPGDSVYVSPFEHNSTLRPLAHLQKTSGLKLQEIPFHPTRFEVAWDRLEVMWREASPAMLVLSQASNVCGLLLPVEELAARARKANPSVTIAVDGAQAAGLYPLNLTIGLIDYLVWSGHKSFYGPFGVAGLAFCTDRRLQPIIFGGTGTISESLEMPEDLPYGLEAGSLNSPAIAGLSAALDWLNQTGRETITIHTAKLMKTLETELSDLYGLRLIKIPSDRRAPVLSLTAPGITPQALEEYLGNQGIAVRAGLHCAPWAHRFLQTLGIGGTIRLSFGYFNHEEQIKYFVNSLAQIID
ncbi:MAG TPA: aminotransferase class V-fold PLP-dependent enzyme [Chloroflexia bacterium]|nr:aminotransferase class V-fold PLP-dependent enzyme [Chloroflexia bacterium]